MACFLVPTTEAIVTTVLEKVLKQKNNTFSVKLGWLNKMLWGGSALLAFEHVWHGEVVPFFPFLTAVKDGNAAEMLHEMGTAGVSMAVLVTAVWGVMVAVSSFIEKRKDSSGATGTAGLAGGLA
ncbi:MAG: hypothetical protein IJJ71_04055 [Treponema sp.]|uniref:hypothetical protein n=1 Tax=Treponema sp. TaxID=166 RepID=UPI0025FF94D7|nr:hypothetical protein [Treponema sp.]MBR0495334.1 hypothetical protein [Treponema sp.]